MASKGCEKINSVLKVFKLDLLHTELITQFLQIGTDIPSILRGLLTPKPPKGEPFRNIPGPRTQVRCSPLLAQDRVCIVGAGPAGIDMALQLKERGFSNVVVFEKSDLVRSNSGITCCRWVVSPTTTSTRGPTTRSVHPSCNRPTLTLS